MDMQWSIVVVLLAKWLTLEQRGFEVVSIFVFCETRIQGLLKVAYPANKTELIDSLLTAYNAKIPIAGCQ